MLRFKITRQQMSHVNVFGCLNNFFRLLQLYIFIYLYIYKYIYVYIYLFIYLYIYIFVYMKYLQRIFDLRAIQCKWYFFANMY